MDELCRLRALMVRDEFKGKMKLGAVWQD